jgi:hypothetical protein
MCSERGCSQSDWGKQSVRGEQGEVRLAKEEEWEAPVLEKELWFLSFRNVKFQTP